MYNLLKIAFKLQSWSAIVVSLWEHLINTPSFLIWRGVSPPVDLFPDMAVFKPPLNIQNHWHTLALPINQTWPSASKSRVHARIRSKRVLRDLILVKNCSIMHLTQNLYCLSPMPWRTYCGCSLIFGGVALEFHTWFHLSILLMSLPRTVSIASPKSSAQGRKVIYIPGINN